MSIAKTSIAAYHTAPLASLRDRVYDIIEAFGEDGCIQDDVIEIYRAGLKAGDKSNTGRLTGRFSELEREKRIVRLGDTRAGVSGKQQLVMRAAKYSGVRVVVSKAIKPAKKKRSGFMNGLMFAAKIMLKESDLESAKRAIKKELLKAAGRT